VPDTSGVGPIERYIGVGADPLAFLPGCNMSFRRDVLAEVGGFNSLLTYIYDDVEICSRVIDKGYAIHLVEDVLVRHDRAANPTRDSGGDDLRDPYPVLYCRAVFAMQCRQPAPRDQEIFAAVQGAADDMENLANSYLEQGTLTVAGRGEFVDRARSGAEDGLMAGGGERPFVSYEPATRALFRPYR